jgi:hypothetical protein
MGIYNTDTNTYIQIGTTTKPYWLQMVTIVIHKPSERQSGVSTVCIAREPKFLIRQRRCFQELSQNTLIVDENALFLPHHSAR